MSARPSHLAAVALLIATALAGCGASTLPATLHDPSTQGVEALRQTIRSALLTHNAKQQCELLAPNLLEDYARTIARCAKIIAATEKEPFAYREAYNSSPSAYTAGGTIETVGNIAIYRRGETIFKAVYTEGAWRIADKEQQ